MLNGTKSLKDVMEEGFGGQRWRQARYEDDGGMITVGGTCRMTLTVILTVTADGTRRMRDRDGVIMIVRINCKILILIIGTWGVVGRRIVRFHSLRGIIFIISPMRIWSG